MALDERERVPIEVFSPKIRSFLLLFRLVDIMYEILIIFRIEKKKKQMHYTHNREESSALKELQVLTIT